MVFPLILGPLMTAGSTIASTVATIGASVSVFLSTVGPTIAGAIETLKPVADVLSKFANVFLQNLAILKPGETVESLGDRALQASDRGIKLEDAESFDDYLTKLFSFELDPSISTQRSLTAKLLAGLSIGTVCVEDKFHVERGSFNGLWLLALTNPAYFTPERVQGLLSVVSLGDEVLTYLDRNLSGGTARGFEKKLEIGTDGKPLGKAEMDALYEGLDVAQEAWAAVAKQIDSNR